MFVLLAALNNVTALGPYREDFKDALGNLPPTTIMPTLSSLWDQFANEQQLYKTAGWGVYTMDDCCTPKRATLQVLCMIPMFLAH